MGPEEPEEYGTYNLPFSTARADLLTMATNTQYPYRASGKLFFQKAPPDNSWYVCSASLIKRGVVATAAHCVADYGNSTFYRNWHFYPGYRNGAAPYGMWTVSHVWVKTSYYNGTDNCYQYGVICPDDVATLLLNPNNSNNYAGTYTGFYA
jgi:V8-like Glu-specific endopeptidase